MVTEALGVWPPPAFAPLVEVMVEDEEEEAAL